LGITAGGGEGGACFARPKGRGGSRARRTIQVLINISFPKIVAKGKKREKFSDIPFFTNLPKFVQFFSNIFVNL
jgi:hypothetical protein